MVLQHLLHGHQAPGVIGRARGYEALTALVLNRRRLYGRLVALADIHPGERVLDIGCGPGYLTALAAQTGAHAVGVDPAESMIQLAQRLRGADDCEFRVGRAESLDLPDESFDVVVSSFAVHHIPEPVRAAAFAEMHRVLKPGGRLLVADFPPPRGRLARHLVGAMTGEAMSANPVERIAPMVGEAGFTAVTSGEHRPFLHHVRAVK